MSENPRPSEEALVALERAQVDGTEVQVVDALGPDRAIRGDLEDHGRGGGFRSQQVGAEVVRAQSVALAGER